MFEFKNNPSIKSKKDAEKVTKIDTKLIISTMKNENAESVNKNTVPYSDLPAFTLFDSYLKKDIKIEAKDTVNPGVVKIYSCGPTVYNYQSIGNMRAVFLPDTLSKTLKIAGYNVEWVLNITDVGHLVGDGDHGEDKVEKMAKASGNTVNFIVNHYTKDYFKQCAALNYDMPAGKFNPKATEYITEQMELVKILLERGFSYILEDGIYFDFLSFQKSADYETLPNSILNSLASVKNDGHTFNDREIENTQKDPRDFALWKFIDENSLQKWRFTDFENVENAETLKDVKKKWGCPGWHSECVAMICKTLNGHFLPKVEEGKYVIDIHMGGEDHIDIHHKNEILQSLGLGFNLSKYWVHNKFVMVDGAKMSKSLGNVFLVTGKKDETGFESVEEKGFNPLSFRTLLLEHSYDQQMNFTWEKLTQAQTRYYNLKKASSFLQGFALNQEIKIELKSDFKPREEFLNILLNNLNTPLFLEKYSTLLNDTVNEVRKNKTLNLDDFRELIFWDKNLLALDLFEGIPEEINQLLKQRAEFKNQKNYEEADKIKVKIETLNHQVDDHFYGSTAWKK